MLECDISVWERGETGRGYLCVYLTKPFSQQRLLIQLESSIPDSQLTSLVIERRSKIMTQ